VQCSSSRKEKVTFKMNHLILKPITATLILQPEVGEAAAPDGCIPYPLRGTRINIGRGAQNDIVLESLQISRRHAELEFDAGKWFIRDVSTNGIVVNAHRLPAHQSIPLRHQDTIQFIPGPLGQHSYKLLYNNKDEVVVEEDEESLLSVKSPPPILLDDRRAHKRKLKHSSGSGSSSSPPSQKRRPPELIQLSDDEDCKLPSENDKPLTDFTESELIEEVKLLRGRLSRAQEQNRKKIDWWAGEKRRLETELVKVREGVHEFGGRINGLLESELSCSVCSEIFVDARVTSCGHTFCSFCIREWLRKKNDCPICRKHIRGCSRHVEIDNFVDKVHALLSPEVQNHRSAFIAERKAQEQRQATTAAAPPQVPQVVNFINQFIMAAHQPSGRSTRRGSRRHRGSAGASSSSAAHNAQAGVIDLSVNQ
jgi:pSer/pThr/pTyr-binding forkhead associated (FHA) protein